MRVAVFGIGYVGAVSAACLAQDGHSVIAVDTNPEKVECVRDGMAPIIEPGLEELIRAGVASGRLRATTDAAEAVVCSELLVICVGTPSLPNGALDLAAVMRVCEQIGATLPLTSDFRAVIVRSTMLPGSTTNVVVPTLEKASGKRAGLDFGVAVCPEFLREGSAIRDYREAPTFVAGVLDSCTSAMLEQLTASLKTKLLLTDPPTAEMLKYANNAWHALKVGFANEIGSIAKSLGIDGRKVMEMLCSDRRLNISPTYLRPGFAFGGSCLPKDLRALLYKARQLDVSCPILEAAPISNEQHIRRAVEMVCARGSRRVGMIGLSFKGGTDDLRESPAMDLAERLFGKGYDIRTFDRNINLARLTGANLSFVENRNPHIAMLLADDVQEVIRHGDTLIVAHHEAADRAALKRLRSDQLIIDLDCVPHTNGIAGLQYSGLCW